MKKTITSAGLVVVGAASLQAQTASAPNLTSFQTSKPWSVSATLRGFYDDNYVTRPSSGVDKERDSFGFEVSPSVGLNWALPQTQIGLKYNYGLRYYEDREDNRADHSHQANLTLNHRFTERYKLDISDTFVVAQEPEILDPGTSRRLRTDGDNIRNTANAQVTAGLTDLLDTVIGYTNTYYDYEQTGVGSLSSLLDRMEHLASFNLRWQASPSTVGLVGYQFGVTEYDDDNVLGIVFNPRTFAFQGITSDIRDSRSHYAYVGGDHSFNSQLNGSLRIGAQFTEYTELDNFGVGGDDSTVSPYVDGSVSYTYNPGSYLQLGVRHTRQATDIAFINAATPTMDQEATTVYSAVNHQITAKLMGSLLAQFQHASFEGGGVDGENENFFVAGLNFAYQINQFLAAETGYNFDRLDSDIANRSFSRNRVYVGIRATY